MAEDDDSTFLGMEDAEARGKTADGDSERINEKSKTTSSESAGEGTQGAPADGSSTTGDGGSTGEAGGASHGGGSTGDTPNA